MAAQGMGKDRDREVGMRQVNTVINTVGQFQIDTVNVLTRAHFMPLYTRLGAYDTSLLTRGSSQAPRRLFEFWGHAASLIDISLYPLFEFRRERAYEMTWGHIRTLVDNNPEAIDAVEGMVREVGPLTARQLNFGQERTKEHWGWNWSLAKLALEWLFWSGRIAVAGRNSQFERIYDIPERVIPAAYLDACQPWATATPTEREGLTHEAHVELVRRASAALGIGTARCIGDYFRTAAAPTKAAIETLVDTGELQAVEVEGISAPVWITSGANKPRQIHTSALVSPFDSLAFERKRLAAFFDIDYTISIYTPADKRVHGYYVYLFLLDDIFAARVDLKADRAKSTLLVQSSWLEADADASRTAQELSSELRRLADWLGLTKVQVVDKGTLAGHLKKHV